MKTILLIEDDRALRENTAELLELGGYKVLTAINGKKGIQIATEKLPDLIICDIMMPEVDGYGVLQNLSSTEGTKQIPFIFLSAITGHKSVRKGMNLGADDYLTKPFEEEDLISAVESRLAKSKLLKQATTAALSNEKINEINDLNQLKNYFDDHGTILKFEQGQHIYEQGARSSGVFLVLKGAIKCHAMDEDGKELTTALYNEDDFLGFTSFIDNEPYQESATALETVELAMVAKEELTKVLQDNPSVSLELMELLSDNIANIKHQLLQMAYSSVRKKTAQTLLQFVQLMNKNPNDPIKISRNDLASVAGIATESLIRTLSGLKKEGLIDIEGRNIKIKDLKALSCIS